jgi:hypothetical protein
VAKTTGIQSDRGRDEDGIQIFIPGFYASDSHVILLDVVAETGTLPRTPIAEVTLRYKDLVYLKNGVTQATLALPKQEKEAAAAERNVLKNFLATKLSAALKQAGENLERGSEAEALNLLRGYQALLGALGDGDMQLKRDKDMVADSVVLSDFVKALQSPGLKGSDQQKFLSLALQRAGLLKLSPHSNDW